MSIANELACRSKVAAPGPQVVTMHSVRNVQLSAVWIVGDVQNGLSWGAQLANRDDIGEVEWVTSVGAVSDIDGTRRCGTW